MNQDEHKIVVRRMAGLIAAASVLIAVYVLRLIFLQLVNSDSFKAQATNTTDYNFTVTAARGDIVDSAGRRIAASTTSYNVVLSKLLMGDEDLDAMLQRIVELLEAHGEKWNDSLLIGEPDAAGHYSFTAQADSTSDQKALAAMKDSLGLQQYATADDVMEKLVEDYKLESYPLHWQRVLGGIHYEMQQQAFSNVNNFVMAENVSEVTVATIKENSLTMPGVEIVETSTRSYDEGDIIPHVLGRVGKITAEKWKVTDENGQTTYPLREKGYNMNDMIGVSGLEAVYEDELRGKDGVETITRSSDGVIVGTAMTTVPEPGHTVQLTIDSAFQQAVDKALAKLKAENPDWDVMGLAPDLTDYAAVEAAMAKVTEAFGRIDILVNNAGITRDNLILRLTEEDFDAVLDANLKGAFLCCKEAARRMVRQRYGRIVNLSSVVALRGNAGQTNYAASKAGLIGLTKSLARELASRNVTVNAVAPGFIETDMTAALPEAVRAEMAKGIPAGRAGSPEDVANAVAFFTAEQSSYLTGQVLCVDGGMAM